MDDAKIIHDEDQGEEDSPPSLSAVVVHATRAEDGGVSTHVEVVGDVRVTEVDTLLALARKGWRERIGISE